MDLYHAAPSLGVPYSLLHPNAPDCTAHHAGPSLSPNLTPARTTPALKHELPFVTSPPSQPCSYVLAMLPWLCCPLLVSPCASDYPGPCSPAHLHSEKQLKTDDNQRDSATAQDCSRRKGLWSSSESQSPYGELPSGCWAALPLRHKVVLFCSVCPSVPCIQPHSSQSYNGSSIQLMVS